MKKTISKVMAAMLVLSVLTILAPKTGEVVKAEQSEKETSQIGRVKKVKKATAYSTYKGWTSTTAKKMSRIKYKYGYRITWKKVKGASGYEVERYGEATKKWTKIKTTKKAKFVLTNTRGAKAKIRIRAYRKSGGKKIYGKYSKTLQFSTGYRTKFYKGGKTKDFSDRYACEEAFVRQNKYRKAAGVKALQWSEEMYQLGLYRLKTSGFDSHKNMDKDQEAYFGDYYRVKVSYMRAVSISENLAVGQGNATEAVVSWKKSKGHYENMIRDRWKSGAVVDYGDIYIATFSSLAASEMDNWRSSLDTIAAICVKRLDKATGKYRAGSKFQFYDAADKWNTMQIYRISRESGYSSYMEFQPGHQYVIMETDPPDGCEKAGKITFTLKPIREGINEFVLAN